MRVPVSRRSVREAADVLQALVDRLGPAPCRSAAWPKRSASITDGAGPLYCAGTEEQLRSTVRDALDALEQLSGW